MVVEIAKVKQFTVKVVAEAVVAAAVELGVEVGVVAIGKVVLVGRCSLVGSRPAH